MERVSELGTASGSAPAGEATHGDPGPGEAAPRRRHGFGDYLERYALILAWVVLVVVFSLLRPDTFATSSNFQTIFGSQAVLLLLTLGLIVPLTTGDFDLSVASALSLSAMVVAILNVNEGWALFPSILAGLAAGGLVGFVNGALVVGLGLNSFIVTLGVGTFLTGLVQWISHSNTISGINSDLTEWTIGNSLLGIPIDFWYGVAATIVLWCVMEYTPLGRRLLFVGRGREVSRLSGLGVGRIRWGALVTSGLIAGAAGVMYAGTLGAADPSSGQTFLLPAFAAAFLGATAILPGRFNAIGTFIAVYFLVSGITGLQLLGLQSFVQQLFYGGALVLAVALSHLARGRRHEASDEGGAGGI
jgi:ribose transport system permease protein